MKTVVLQCLKRMSDFDPEGARLATENIWKGFAKEAGVDRRTLRRALNRITWDGYYGPISETEYQEFEDHGNTPEALDTPMTLHCAKDIVRHAMEFEPHITYTHPDCGYMCTGVAECNHPDHEELGDDGPLFHEEPIAIDPDRIRRDCFHAIYTIYGGRF